MQVQVIIVFTVQTHALPQPMKWKVENIITLTGRQSWWTAALSYLETTKETQPLEQADAAQPLPWWLSKAPHSEDVSFYSLCTTTEVVVWPHQQAGQQKDKEKVITNIYLQYQVRALWVFLSPLEKVGRCGERFTEVLTLHSTLNFLEFMAASWSQFWVFTYLAHAG